MKATEVGRSSCSEGKKAGPFLLREDGALRGGFEVDPGPNRAPEVVEVAGDDVEPVTGSVTSGNRAKVA